MSADAQLAAQQGALVRALTGQGPVPSGFDAGRVDVVARALVVKRLRAVRRVWPGLARGLGEGFDRLFVAYATKSPSPRDGGALADGDGFVGHLLVTGRCPDEARRERLAVILEYRRTPDGLVRRSGFSVLVHCTLLRSPRRVAVGLRLFRWTVLI